MFEIETRMTLEREYEKEKKEHRNFVRILAAYTLVTGVATALYALNGQLAEAIYTAIPTAITGIGAWRLRKDPKPNDQMTHPMVF